MSDLDRTLALIALMSAAGAACAQQATLRNDGQWRALLGAGYSNSTGNTRSSSLTLNGDAVRATDHDKWALYGKALYARAAGATSGEQARLGTRYDWNLTTSVFSFGGLEVERDRVAELDLRTSVNTGLGYKFLNLPDATFNVFGGVSYTRERYSELRVVDGVERARLSYYSGVFGEESSHKLTHTTTINQRLAFLPNLSQSGSYRVQFESALSVAVTETMQLNVGFGVRHNSTPGNGLRKTDSLLTTGIAVKFD